MLRYFNYQAMLCYCNYYSCDVMLVYVILFYLIPRTGWSEVLGSPMVMSGADIHSPLFLFVYGLWPMRV